MDVLKVTGYRIRPPHLVAEEKGFFADENLKIDYHLTTYAPDHNRGMAEGRWHFTLSSADTMIARTTTDGTDYVLFMQAEEGLDAYLVGQPEIRSIEDLRGKLLAGDPGDSNLDLIRKKILHEHGVKEGEYSVEIIGSSPVRFQAFREGRVAAAMLAPPHSDQAIAAGGRLLAEAARYVPNWPLTCGWALRSWAESHRELIVRFIRAWVRATDWVLDKKNHDELVDLLMNKGSLSRQAAETAIQKTVPKARINLAALRVVVDLRKEMGVYKPPYLPLERFYDFSYWCAATGLPAPTT
ncbi:MAG TPA: ABC transporter substrate-binding protein [Candidatus Acidoferrales bacterium]|nr:ABC transporter substrate-binding protein [Candidatus Acidoferrales bacterium]